MPITVINDSNINLVVQIKTIGTHRSTFLKVGEEVTWNVGPGLPIKGWTIYCHYNPDGDFDDTTWKDYVYAPAVAIGSIIAGAVTGGIGAYMGASIGALALTGTGMVIAEGAFVGTGSALGSLALEQVKDAASSLEVADSHYKLKSSFWSGSLSQRARITGGMLIETNFKKGANGESEFESMKDIGGPLVATNDKNFVSSSLDELVEQEDTTRDVAPAEAGELIARAQDVAGEKSNKIRTLDDFLAASGTGGDAQTVSSVVVMPPKETYDMAEIKKQLRNIQLLSTFANAYGMKLLYNERKDKPFDLGNAEEKGEFTRCAASAIHYAITKSMGTFLPLTEAQEFSFEKDYNQKEFHMEFLKEIFGSFDFTTPTLLQLDAVLTQVFSNLSNIKMTKSSENDSLAHLIYMYYFDDVKGFEQLKVAKLRLFYLHIDNESWSKIVEVGKSSTTNVGFKFNMSYLDFKFDMNEENVERNRPKIEEVIQSMTDKNFEDISKIYSLSMIE